MPDVRETFKEAWSQALVGLNAAEQEAEKVLARSPTRPGSRPRTSDARPASSRSGFSRSARRSRRPSTTR